MDGVLADGLISLGTVRAATNTAAITTLVEERILPGTGWRALEVRRRGVRLEPPEAYWAVYRIRITPEGAATEEGGEERDLRLVVRAVFDRDTWLAYSARLRRKFGEQPCRPVDGLGHPILFDDSQHAVWFYPVDPNLPGLVRCADPAYMRRLFRQSKHELLERWGRIHDVQVTRARYLPEISAILRYDIETVPESASRTVFGKVQRAGRNDLAVSLLKQVWDASLHSEGALQVPRPLAYWADLGIFLQSAAPGEAVGSDRSAEVFLPAAEAAAEALAVIHEMDVDLDLPDMPVEHELERLDTVVTQFILTHPPAHLMLRDLLERIRLRLDRTRDEDVLPTHGDLKYDQLIHNEGSFSIIDFDYFGQAETSYDLGKFCAHLVPSQPKGWEDSYAAEQARTIFLDTYRRARPHATLDRFPIYEAINLANRSMTLMWSQSPGWELAAETMLVLALERLNTPLP